MSRLFRLSLLICIASQAAQAQLSIQVPKLTDIDVSTAFVTVYSGTRGLRGNWGYRLAAETVFATSSGSCVTLKRSAQAAAAAAQKADTLADGLREEARSEGKRAVDVKRYVEFTLLEAERDAAQRHLEADRLRVALEKRQCTDFTFQLGVGYSQLLEHGQSNLFVLDTPTNSFNVYGYTRDLPQVSLYVSYDFGALRQYSTYLGATIAYSTLSTQFFDPSGAQVQISGDTFSPALRAGISFAILKDVLIFVEGAYESQVFSNVKYSSRFDGMPSSVDLSLLMAIAGVELHLQD